MELPPLFDLLEDFLEGLFLLEDFLEELFLEEDFLPELFLEEDLPVVAVVVLLDLLLEVRAYASGSGTRAVTATIIRYINILRDILYRSEYIFDHLTQAVETSIFLVIDSRHRRSAIFHRRELELGIHLLVVDIERDIHAHSVLLVSIDQIGATLAGD